MRHLFSATATAAILFAAGGAFCDCAGAADVGPPPPAYVPPPGYTPDAYEPPPAYGPRSAYGLPPRYDQPDDYRPPPDYGPPAAARNSICCSPGAPSV
jgi:hypothetical protein